MPGPLAALVTSVLGPDVDVWSRSWPGAASRVWEARAPNGAAVFAKVHSTPKFHRREVAAYESWVTLLGEDTPRLLACDSALPGILVTPLPGVPVKFQPLPPGQDAEVHALAGALARRIHDTAICPAATASALPSAYVLKHLGRARLTDADLSRAQAVLVAAAQVTLPMVPTHGDFQPRNWLYNNDSRVRVIDFERAEPGASVRDFRLLVNGPWQERPDLREAFFDGYGRSLTTDEEIALAGWVVLDALDSAHWGAKDNDAEVLARGLAGLAQLRNGR
ncbi:phosphotransferase [Yinghuangia aomiensis]